MVPRHDPACNRDRRDARRAAGAHGLACRDHRNSQARLADRADPGRPDRHDDDRPCADRAARRWRDRGRRARASHSVRRLRARHGAGVSGRAPHRTGLRRAQASHGAPRAARGSMGRRDARRSDQYRAALGRGDPHGGRPIIGHGGACRALSRRLGLVDDPRLVLHRAAQLHGRGQSSGTGAMDHARGNSGQCLARLCADPRRLRPAAPRSARRGAGDHRGQSCDVCRRNLGLLHLPPVQEVSRARAASGGRTGS